jgi:hypothetical protein
MGCVMWVAFTVGRGILRGRVILAPGYQGLHCNDVDPVIIGDDVCSLRGVWAYVLEFVTVGCGCQVSQGGVGGC